MQTNTTNSHVDKRSSVFHFEVQGGQVGHAFASVNALNLVSAHILMSALFPGSEATEIEEPPVTQRH